MAVAPDGSAAADLAAADLARADLAAADLAPSAADAAAAVCGKPWLLIGVENLANTGDDHGRVARFSLAPGAVAECAPFTARGLMPAQPLAVAYVPGHGVIAATRDGVFALNDDDTVKWSHAAGADTSLPVDVFPLDKPGGGTRVAVAWYSGPAVDISRVDVFADGSGPQDSFPLNHAGGIPLSFGVPSMTASPLDPTHFLALENGAASSPRAASDVDPWNKTKQLYASYPGSADLSTIYGFVTLGVGLQVWVDQTSNAVFRNSDVMSVKTMGGPYPCSGRTCTLVHAVPDPVDGARFYALCENPPGPGRDLVRFSQTGGTCDVIWAASQAGANTRMSRLAVALP
jgi:hypothetical protein